MAYRKGPDKPEPITSEELTDRKEHFDRVYLDEWDSDHAGHVHRG